MRIVFVGYRQWAKDIYNNIVSSTNCDSIFIESKTDLSFDLLSSFNPDLVLFYGWSWLVDEIYLDSFTCLMLHPSPLPKYRGGTPLQNQIINDDLDSAVTIFKMTSVMDAGPICSQEYLSLRGDLSVIFSRIVSIGTRMTLDIINNGISFVEQDHNSATVFQRRKPSESEITLWEIQNSSSNYLYNKIRMLQDPYPNAFIRASDGKKLFITSAFLDDN